jgi:hypothetical protein
MAARIETDQVSAMVALSIKTAETGQMFQVGGGCCKVRIQKSAGLQLGMRGEPATTGRTRSLLHITTNGDFDIGSTSRIATTVASRYRLLLEQSPEGASSIMVRIIMMLKG